MSEAAVATPQKSTINAASEPNHKAGRRQCACGQHTIAGGQCDACRQKRLTLQRKDKTPTGPTRLTADAVAHNRPPRFGADFTHVHLRTAPAMLQRLPRGVEAAIPEETAVPTPTSATAEATPTAEPGAAPAPTSESAASGETAVPGLLVADEATDLGAGQMRKGAFLAELRTAVCAAADTELAAAGRDTEGCPYLDYWFDYYGQRDAGHIERALRRYAPQAQNMVAAREYIPLVAERVRQGVARWASTGQISGMPEGIPLISGALGSMSGLLAGVGTLFFRARPGGVREAGDPHTIQAQLGHGRGLDSGVRTRMESAFGTSFSHVQLHNDNNAARLSSSQNARAFTVGQHIAFGAGEYRPGTLLGDALIAHELAHVVQQSGATTSVAPMKIESAGYETLEMDADRAAVAATTSLWGNTTSAFATVIPNAIPRLRSGLRLQRCASTQTPQVHTTQPTPTATTNYGCPPILENPQWQVAQTPILRLNNGCNVQLAQSGGGEGMEFTGLVNMGGNCNGSVYFVQYAHPNRTLVYCTPSNRTEGLCVTPPWSIDKSWPYPQPYGTNFTMSTSGSSTEQRQARIVDSPGQENISNPSIPRARICIRDEFVTYLVFEPANGSPMPLAWLEWNYNAQAWRNSGNCPPTSTTNDCTGWQVTGTGAKGRESFVPGNMHSSVPLNRSAPVISPPFGLLGNATDCADTNCPLPSTGGSGAK